MDYLEIQIKMQVAFRAEAADLLIELDASMLELESRPQDAELLNRVFRAIHTIKGSGATAGFSEMAAFTHHVEELFDEARMGRLIITPEMIDLALQAKDLIGQMLDASHAGGSEPACSLVVKALAKFLPEKITAIAGGSGKAGTGAALRQRHKIFFKPHPRVFFSGSDPIKLVDELRCLGEAAVVASVSGIPSMDTLDPEQCYLAWDVELVSDRPIESIREVIMFVEDESEIRIESRPEPASGEPGPRAIFLNIADQSMEALGGFLAQIYIATEPDVACCKNYLRVLKTFQAAARRQGQVEPAAVLEEQIQLVEPAAAAKVILSDEATGDLAEGHRKLLALIESLRHTEQQTPSAIALGAVSQPGGVPAPEAPKNEAPRAAASVRVDQEKLDRLMQSAGELLVARNAFPMLAKRLAVENGLSAMAKELKDAGDHISRIAEDLQAAVMSIRMMPIRTVFQRFPRMVRDICRAQGKEAELLLEGEDTALDKTVIEQIADPLVHLVRNAADHGVELPEGRAQAGKPRSGRITLKAYNNDNNVVIEIQDDGRGMDTARLKQKALEKGLITPEAAQTMDHTAALQLIFLPGLSTAEQVTDISGRGVGMDVVRSNIRQLHGTIILESELGKGSRITITLPASLMVSKGILVEASGEEYVFPIASVVQMVRLPRDQIHCHEQANFATIRNAIYPVLRLADHFASTKYVAPIGWAAEVPMAIVQTNRGRVGVAVDRFLGDVEVIVKPMGRDFTHITAFQGATIMGDGRVALVINPAGLV